MATSTASKLPEEDLARAIRREGTALKPALVGVSAASKLLGMKPSNFSRDARPHLTEIPVEGSAAVFLRSEVRKLAQKRARRARSNGH